MGAHVIKVGLNPVLIDLFKQALPENKTRLVKNAQYCGAYGAALFARGLAEKQAKKFSQSELSAQLTS